MPKAEVIACHGWGFDAACWDVWKPYFPDDVSFSAFDRGYFSAAHDPVFTPDNHGNIVLAHSFGLHLCDERILNQADLLVIFGGFLSFHPRAAQFRRRSRLMLNQMINRLKDDPRQVLETFYKNTFHPQDAPDLPEGRLNMSLLLNDLQKLNEQEMEIKRLNNIPKVCILHGFRDGIVPCAKGRELYDKLQSGAKYMEVKHAGHALPFTHSGQCWSFVKSEFELSM